MADRILTLDIGSSKALLAEFSVKGGKPVLLRFASGPLPVEGDDVGSSERLADVVRTLIRENGIKPAPMYVALPGQSVFARFFKLPPLGKDQVGETVRAEAEQSVPFPIDEVVWDYQVLGSNDGVELDEPYTGYRPSYPLYRTANGVDVSFPYTVPEGEIWVMGDNRTSSQDSRYFGSVKLSSVTGRAAFIYWPVSDVGFL